MDTRLTVEQINDKYYELFRMRGDLSHLRSIARDSFKDNEPINQALTSMEIAISKLETELDEAAASLV